MAKGKYEAWINDPDKLTLLAGWARKGLSDEQIAKNMGIRRSTLNEWRKKFPVISDALKKNKEVCDTEVENSLYKKCTGFYINLKKTFKVKTVTYNEDTGKKIGEKEELKEGIEQIYIPPDTAAIKFWLANRNREEWKERFPVAIEDAEDEEEGIPFLAPADIEAAKKEIEKEKLKDMQEENGGKEKEN